MLKSNTVSDPGSHVIHQEAVAKDAASFQIYSQIMLLCFIAPEYMCKMALLFAEAFTRAVSECICGNCKQAAGAFISTRKLKVCSTNQECSQLPYTSHLQACNQQQDQHRPV